MGEATPAQVALALDVAVLAWKGDRPGLEEAVIRCHLSDLVAGLLCLSCLLASAATGGSGPEAGLELLAELRGICPDHKPGGT